MTDALELAEIVVEMAWDPGFMAILPICLEVQEAPL